jgi:hypothetical protein
MTTQICACRRCGRELDPVKATFEWQESVAIQYRAGYGSIMGDGNLVETVLCQHCIQSLLGPWLNIIIDDPVSPRHIAPEPRSAYQPNQMALAHNCRPVPTQDELRRLFSQTTDREDN